MRYARSTTLLGLTFVLAASAPASCNSKAVGVAECRRIEDARCEAAIHCPDNFDVDDVAACQRFYRDQCLHGLDVKKAPDKSEVTACVEVIDRLGTCAKKNGADSLVDDCGDVESTVTKVDTVCELLKRPEAAPECDFIATISDEGAGGEAGSAGNAGASSHAGTSGSAGASSGGAGGAS